MNFFLDFDLAILGKPFEGHFNSIHFQQFLEYEIYSSNIRKEYIHYSPDAYKKGRIEVLKKLLEGNLFQTIDFRKRFEKEAKLNIKKEIENFELS